MSAGAVGGRRLRRSSVPCGFGGDVACLIGGAGVSGSLLADFGSPLSSSMAPIEDGERENDFVHTVGRWGAEWPS